jgi:hypothetical protein
VDYKTKLNSISNTNYTNVSNYTNYTNGAVHTEFNHPMSQNLYSNVHANNNLYNKPNLNAHSVVTGESSNIALENVSGKSPQKSPKQVTSFTQKLGLDKDKNPIGKFGGNNQFQYQNPGMQIQTQKSSKSQTNINNNHYQNQNFAAEGNGNYGNEGEMGDRNFRGSLGSNQNGDPNGQGNDLNADHILYCKNFFGIYG